MSAEVTVEGGLKKAPTGIIGFDDITKGGLPVGRASLIVGGPGSGKTLFAMQFLVNGAMKFNEPGVFFSFEESANELAQNVASLGFDLKALEAKNMLAIDQVQVEAAEVIETGEYDLEGLFLRLGYAIDSIGAKRVVLDTIEAIFSSFTNSIILRSELRRLFRFLKDRGVTVLITGERGDGGLTRNGLEEYVSDAVIVLDNRIIGNISTRRMRIIKYRGSSHGSNEYPFLIDDGGFSVLPISSLALTARATDERISSGIPDLDDMLEGKGYYKGSTILITGLAGTGKTSFAALFVRKACEDGKRALFLTFEESSSQILRNMRSIGVDLQPLIDGGLLRIAAERPTSFGLEMHLVSIHKMVREFKPEVVVLDPMSSLMAIGEDFEVRSTMVRMIDYLKMNDITSMLTDLKHGDRPEESSMISSMVDTWIRLEVVEASGESNRILRLLKSRGMAHSNQIREFNITREGIKLTPPYIGSAGVLTGSARFAQETRDRIEEEAMNDEISKLTLDIEQRRKVLDAQVEMMNAEYEREKEEMVRRIDEVNRRKGTREAGRGHMLTIRTAKTEENE